METYEVKFYKDGNEIELSKLPMEYRNGVINALRDENNREERFLSVFGGMVKDK